MEQPPLIAHIIYAVKTGGLENGLINIINKTPPDRYRHAIICLTETGRFSGRTTAQNVSIIALNKAAGNNLAVYFRLWKAIRTLKPAIVHTRNLAALEMQLICFLFPDIKRLHSEHGREVSNLDGENIKYNLLHKLMKPFVHRYITISRDLEQWLIDQIKVTPGKVRHIYNGVDQNIFYPRAKIKPPILPEGFLPARGILIGTVGRLVEVKDQMTLVKAFALLFEQHPELIEEVRLAIIGDGPMRDSIIRFADDAAILELVWLPGNRGDVADLLRTMDIFVLPSLAEGISNTILEAMATGLPVIATKVGGNPELVKHEVNGFLVPRSHPQALSDSIYRFVRDRKLRKSMGIASLKYVKKRFTWDCTVAKYLKVYDELHATPPSSKSASGSGKRFWKI